MSWFYETKSVPSEKNGVIRCRRFLGRWEVFVGETHEGSRYLERMWRHAIERLPDDFRARSVLMIGLGLGDTIDLWRGRFPECRITAIEWDPVMISLAREFRVSTHMNTAGIILGDAAAVLPRLRGPYDLIQVDAFTGSTISAGTTAAPAIDDCVRLLSPSGRLFVNAYLEPDHFAGYDARFERQAAWLDEYNHLAIYKK